MASTQNPIRNAWVQLYEARRVPNEQEIRSPGRPPSVVPRRKVGLTLSQGEITELENWRARFQSCCTVRCRREKRWVSLPASAPTAITGLITPRRSGRWRNWWKR